MLPRNSPQKQEASSMEPTLMSITTIISIIICYSTQLRLASATTTTTRTSIRGTTQHFFLYLLLYLFNNYLWFHPSLKTRASIQKPICRNLHANSIVLLLRITSSLNQLLLLVSRSIFPSISNSPFCLQSCFVSREVKNLFFRLACLVYLEKKFPNFLELLREKLLPGCII